ncbi:hypothetical protein MMC30_004166 [Trapelia coarctata]|nr:hypothetical protein [Trapelia coarctata]
MRSSNLFLSCFYLSLTLTAASPSPINLARDLPSGSSHKPILQPRGQCLGSCGKGQPPPAGAIRPSGPHSLERLEISQHGAGGSEASAGPSSHRRPSVDRERFGLSPNQPRLATPGPRPARSSIEESGGSRREDAQMGSNVQPSSLRRADSPRKYTGSRGSFGSSSDPDSPPPPGQSMGSRPRSSLLRGAAGKDEAAAGPSSPLSRSSSEPMVSDRKSVEKSVSFARIGDYPGTPQLGRDSMDSGSVRSSSSRKLQPLFEAVSTAPSPATPRGGSRPPLEQVDSPGSGDFMAERWARIQARKGLESPRVAGGSDGGTPSSTPPGSNRNLDEAQLDRSAFDQDKGSPRGGIDSPPPRLRRAQYGKSASDGSGLRAESNPSIVSPRRSRSAENLRSPERSSLPKSTTLSQSANPPNPPPGPTLPNTPDTRLLRRGLGASKPPKNLPEHATQTECRGPNRKSCERKCYCTALADVSCDIPTRKTENMTPKARTVFHLVTKETCAPDCMCEYNAEWKLGQMTPAEVRALEDIRAGGRAGGGGTALGVPVAGAGAGDEGTGPSGAGHPPGSGAGPSNAAQRFVGAARPYVQRLLNPAPQSQADTMRMVPRSETPLTPRSPGVRFALPNTRRTPGFHVTLQNDARRPEGTSRAKCTVGPDQRFCEDNCHCGPQGLVCQRTENRRPNRVYPTQVAEYFALVLRAMCVPQCLCTVEKEERVGRLTDAEKARLGRLIRPL